PPPAVRRLPLDLPQAARRVAPALLLVPGRLLPQEVALRTAKRPGLRGRLLPQSASHGPAQREGLRGRLPPQDLPALPRATVRAAVHLRPTPGRPTQALSRPAAQGIATSDFGEMTASGAAGALRSPSGKGADAGRPARFLSPPNPVRT